MKATADMAHKMMMIAANNVSFEDSGFAPEYKDDYEEIVESIKQAPEGTMLTPINEWAGDEYDDFVSQILLDVADLEKSRDKSLGNFSVSKAEGEKRYTLGAMYIPDIVDAHGEWTDSDELQKAVWDYVRTNDRGIRLQHNRDVVAGEWVEVMAFPYSLTVPVTMPSGEEMNHTYPPNTVFLGVVWEPWAWELVKEGKILGYSIGGKAERLYVEIEDDLEKSEPTVNDVHVDTIMKPSKKKPKKVENER